MTRTEAFKAVMEIHGIPFSEIQTGRITQAPDGSFRVVLQTEDGLTLTEVVAG